MKHLSRPTSGAALVVIGILHTSIGLVEYRAVLREMVRDGMIDTVEGEAEREAAFWFLTCGVSLVSMGWSLRWARRQKGTSPSFVGPALLDIAMAGIAFIPRSGFWAVFVADILAYGERDQQGG